MCARALSRRRISRRSAERSIKPLRRFAPASLIGEPRRRKDLKCPSENIRWPATPPGSSRPASASASSPARAATSSSSTTSWWWCYSASGSTSANRYISPAATAPPNIMPPWAAARAASTCWAEPQTSGWRVCRWLPWPSRARRHRAVPEGCKASRPQDRLDAYRYSGE